jgi:hypothetical protein
LSGSSKRRPYFHTSLWTNGIISLEQLGENNASV